jgi:hypothetical protein
MRTRKSNFKNKKGRARQIWRSPARFGGQTKSSDKSKPPPKFANHHSTYIHIFYNNNPKGEARRLDPGTSPYTNALTIALPPLGQQTTLCSLPHFLVIIRVCPWTKGGRAHDSMVGHENRDVAQRIKCREHAHKPRRIFSRAWECQSHIEAWRQSFLGNSTPRIQWCCLFSDLRKCFCILIPK